jgi:aminopeptidase-like protein
MKISEIPSGSKCFDWEIPLEWNIRDAYIIKPDGTKICDFKKCNLHVLGYSIPVNKTISLKDLQEHLFSLPSLPDAIPYCTSYYHQRWGFCISENERNQLEDGDYHVYIDSKLEPGSISIAEVFLPGESEKEIFFSTYLCHPSMANNELSGPAVATYLFEWLMSLPKRNFSYRLIIIPETIGSIAYLSQNLPGLKSKMIAGFNLTCLGDNRAYSYLPSRNGKTLADNVAIHCLKHLHPEFIHYSFLDRGSDERQYCSPGVDLPVCSIMRSKYACYPEYHTSLDNLDFISIDGLQGSFEVLQKCVELIENNKVWNCKVLCEPQLGKRNLYPQVSSRETKEIVHAMMDFLAYCDGDATVLEIAEKINLPAWSLFPIIEKLEKAGLLEVAN